jgi:AraC family transcriptional regulator
MFVTGGQYVTNSDGETPSDATPFVFNPPGTWHRDRFVASRGSFFTVAMPRGVVDTEQPLPRAPTQIGHGHARSLVRRLMAQWARWDACDALGAESLALELVGAMTRGGTDERRAPRWLREACELLRAAALDGTTIESASRTLGVHPIHLARTFRRFLRCTPGEYLQSRRAEYAARLLKETPASLSEVALASGYADQSHFTRRFRAAYGVAPGSYRKLVG